MFGIKLLVTMSLIASEGNVVVHCEVTSLPANGWTRLPLALPV
jgi:hypothetical protein